MEIEVIVKKESGYSYKLIVSIIMPCKFTERGKLPEYRVMILQRKKGFKKWCNYSTNEITKNDINKAYLELYDMLKPKLIF